MRSVMTFLLVTLCAGVHLTALPQANVFIKNSGQWSESVLFGAVIPNGMFWITTTGMTVDVRTPDANGKTASSAITYSVIGSRGSSTVQELRTGAEPTLSVYGGTMNGQLHTASAVTVKNVLPGVDVEYLWDGGSVRYNVHAAAGITPPNPLFSVAGGTVRSNGSSITTTGGNGSVSMTSLASFQGDTRQPVPTSVRVVGNTFGFSTPQRIVNNSLLVDPIVQATGITGNAESKITCMRRLPNGGIVVAGWTSATSFTGLPDGIPSTRTGAGEDGFIIVLAKDLHTIQHIAFLTGAKTDKILDVTVNSKGDIFVVGSTNSADLPVSTINVGKSYGSGTDGFIAGFKGDLSKQILGMYLPGNGDDVASGVTVNSFDDVVVCGTTSSTSGIRAEKNLNTEHKGDTDGFIYVVNHSLMYADLFTLLDGTGTDSFARVAIDKYNAIAVCGTTTSLDFPTFPKKVDDGGDDGKGGGIEPAMMDQGKDCFGPEPYGGKSDALVARLSAAGELQFSGYFGGSGADEAVDLFSDADVGVYIVGRTKSPTLPFQDPTTAYGAGWDGFVALISSDGLRVNGSAFISGSGDELVTACVQTNGTIGAVIGTTSSPDFTATGSGATGNPTGQTMGFVRILSASLLKYSSTLAVPNKQMQPTGLIVDAVGDIEFAGNIIDPNSETTTEVFGAKWAFGQLTYQGPTSKEAICAGQQVTVRWVTQDLDPQVNVFVDFSTDNGTTWTEVGTKLKGKNFNYTIPPTIPENSVCRFRVRTERGHTASTTDPLTVTIPPVITTQPAGKSGCPGDQISLAVQNTGNNVTYQWRKNTQPISGATSATLTLQAVSANDNGSYDVQLTNECGTTASQVAKVTIANEPVIDQQPQSATVGLNSTVVLSVGLSGTGYTFQWKKNGTEIEGATEATYTIASTTADDAGSYTCTITSSCGTTTSNPATVTIDTSVGVSEQLADGSTLSIRPSPVAESGYVHVPALLQPADLVVYNMMGAEVMRIHLTPMNNTQTVAIATATLPAGNYTLVLQGAAIMRTATMVVVR